MTYSIVAFDTAKRDFGIAVASCVPLETVQKVPGFVPDRGAYVTQSFLHQPGWVLARNELANGATAEATIAAMIDPSFDPEFAKRQYAVIDIDGGAASFTGDLAMQHASHRTGNVGPFVYALQGNILASAPTIAEMERGFTGDACDLPARLVRALEGASIDRGGDSRCTPLRPAQSIVVQVPSRGLMLEVEAGGDGPDPTIQLRKEFDVWRDAHPCPTIRVQDTSKPDEGCRQSAASSLDASLALPLVVFAVVHRLTREGAA